MLHLGTVTWMLAADWDLDTLLARCEETGFEGVELRTTHAHGVEPELDATGREHVRRRFEASPVQLVGLGTVYEYHALDVEVLRANIEGTKRAIELAADVGAQGVKVRPNGHQESAGVPRARTLEQIGYALAECGEYAAGKGVELRLEMHGSVASAPDIAQILRACGHPSVKVCWNCEGVDVKGGSVREAFDLMRGHVGLVHVRELWDPGYPYRELFALLSAADYGGFCLAEIGGNPDPVRLMRYYCALWQELVAR